MGSDRDLRLNHDFVTAFETLRKRFGYREMGDAALQDIAALTGADYATLRSARHLRNALAHADPVNREKLAELNAVLADVLGAGRKDGSISPAGDARSGLVRAFRLHAWLDAELEARMLANGFVSIGGEELGDLSSVHDTATIGDILFESMPDKSDRAIALFVGYWRRFLWEAVCGDLVVLPLRNRMVAMGEFVGSYHFVAGAEPHARHRRAVSWDGTVSRDAFDRDLLVTLNGQHTVQEFKAPDAAARLRRLL